MSRGAGNGLGAPQSLSRACATPMPRPAPLRGPCGLLSALVRLHVRGLGAPKEQAACHEKKQGAANTNTLVQGKGSRAQDRCVAPSVAGPYSLIHVINCGNPHAYWPGGPNRFLNEEEKCTSISGVKFTR